MDPQLIGPEQWDHIGRALANLVIFVGLAVNGALALLLAHAVIPSLVTTQDAPREALALRWVLYPVFVASLVLTLYALGRALYLAVVVIQSIYPRFAV
ncbi:MAG: hypothetical protein HY690_12195 [Chloroflexi bacterium]|nr:hypothetical protein [Chloroflexota bacterium]